MRRLLLSDWKHAICKKLRYKVQGTEPLISRIGSQEQSHSSGLECSSRSAEGESGSGDLMDESTLSPTRSGGWHKRLYNTTLRRFALL